MSHVVVERLIKVIRRASSVTVVERLMTAVVHLLIVEAAVHVLRMMRHFVSCRVRPRLLVVVVTRRRRLEH